jgi:hypothetical protein
MMLRNKIKELDELIKSSIKEEIKNFKRKYDILKNSNEKFSMQYEIIYSALFGTNVTI